MNEQFNEQLNAAMIQFERSLTNPPCPSTPTSPQNNAQYGQQIDKDAEIMKYYNSRVPKSYIVYIDDDINRCLATFQLTKEKEMLQLNPNPTRAFQRVTYIYGRVAQQLSVDEIAGYIKHVEDRIKGLKSLQTPSEKINAEIKKLEADAKRIATYLDERSY